MCGIIAVYDPVGLDYSEQSEMLNSIAHRGPDANGMVNSGPYYFGHSRLSIQDTSRRGNQPFSDKAGNILCYNGEIYNTRFLVSKYLFNYELESTSDTEILFYLLRDIGVNSLDDIEGMFAFVFKNVESGQVILSRDPFGIKPLFFGYNSERAMVCSEINGIRQHIETVASQDDCFDWLHFGFCIKNRTVFKNVVNLEPGVVYEWSESSLKEIYSFKLVFSETTKSKETATHLSKIKSILINSIQMQYESADVDRALMLSGGIDSTLILSLMVEELNIRPKTFSLAFENKRTDESERISFLIEKYDLHDTHETIYISEKEVYDLVNGELSFPSHLVSNPSYIIMEFLSKKISDTGIKVAYNGLGGDELFYGYNRHVFHNFMRIFPESQWIGYVGKILNRYSSRYSRLANLVRAFSIGFLAKHPNIGNSQYYSILPLDESRNRQIGYENDLRRLDLTDSMPKDLLYYSDLAGMRHGLEVRYPFLSIEMFKYVSKIDKEFFMNKTQGKLPLKKILSEYLGNSFVSLPKRGFVLPLENYFETNIAHSPNNESDIYNVEYNRKNYDLLYRKEILKKIL